MKHQKEVKNKVKRNERKQLQKLEKKQCQEEKEQCKTERGRCKTGENVQEECERNFKEEQGCQEEKCQEEK